MITSTNCPNCNYCSNTIDPFLILQLEINNNMNTLTDAIEKYNDCKLDESNLWTCDSCHNKVNANIGIKFSKTSDVMIIQLKKYKNLNKFIEYPDILDVSKYSYDYNNRGTKNSDF